MTRRPAIIAGSVLAALLLAFFAGPSVTIDTQLKPFTLPADLDEYLARSEARFPDIIPGTEKKIIWAHAAKTKTPLAIVYLHGFSATRQETAPLCDSVAARLGANLFYTRLTGHGRGGPALAEASVNDWLNDTEEAYEIGRRLGDSVIVIGTSTGATLATWLAEQANTQSVAAYVLMSPNYALKDGRSEVLTWPWGARLAALIAGPEISSPSRNELDARYWTHRYPSRALVPMLGLLKFVRASEVERIRAPMLVVYSPSDQVLDARVTERVYARLGSRNKQVRRILHSQNPSGHVLAGDIAAPRDTPMVARLILGFIASLR